MGDIQKINKVLIEFQENAEATMKKYFFKNQFIPIDSTNWGISHQFIGNLIAESCIALDPRSIELKSREILDSIHKNEFKEFIFESTSLKKKNSAIPLTKPTPGIFENKINQENSFYQYKKTLETDQDFIDFMDQSIIGPWGRK